jgi:3-phosphoshikimate 1-carboxyvinyltransferase
MGNRDLNISKEVNIDSFGDHRIAMSFLIAGLRFDSEVHVDDCKNIDTSFPSFFKIFSSLGAEIKTA